MPPTATITNIALGHGAWCPSPCLLGCMTVMTGSLPNHRMFDQVMTHLKGCVTAPHPRATGIGSTNVFTCSMPQARLGDLVLCES